MGDCSNGHNACTVWKGITSLAISYSDLSLLSPTKTTCDNREPQIYITIFNIPLIWILKRSAQSSVLFTKAICFPAGQHYTSTQQLSLD